VDTVIRNVKLTCASGWMEADIGIEDGLVAAIGSVASSGAKESFNARGAFCLPGAVDLHVHFNEPGRTRWEGFASGTAAAAAGGACFVADMPLNSAPPATAAAALKRKRRIVETKARIDFGLWGGLVPGNADQIEPMAEAGAIGFKGFLCPSGINDFPMIGARDLRTGMERVARTGRRLALHAEDAAVLGRGSPGPRSGGPATRWEAARPPEAEMRAIRLASQLAGETGCPIAIVHVSCLEALAEVEAARRDGVDVACETCPHYLRLSTSDAERLGPVAKCAPPLRPAETVAAMRDAFLQGRVDTLGSDHSPCPTSMKSERSFETAWGGISGIQHGLALVLDFFGLDDAASVARVAEAAAARPAALVGLPGKGRVAIGAEADLTLWREDPMPRALERRELLYRNRHSAYLGMATRLRMERSWLRGRPLFVKGRFISPPGGRFVAFGPEGALDVPRLP